MFRCSEIMADMHGPQKAKVPYCWMPFLHSRNTSTSPIGALITRLSSSGLTRLLPSTVDKK